mgnify:CR=1 FL=1|jgi:hypothetical protein
MGKALTFFAVRFGIRIRVFRAGGGLVRFFPSFGVERFLQLAFLRHLFLELLSRFELIHHPAVIAGVEAVVPVPFLFETQLHVALHVLVRRDIRTALVRADPPRPLHAVLPLVCHRAAVLARAFSELTGLERFHPPFVPTPVRARPVINFPPRLLVLQPRLLRKVPRRRGHELGNVRVDLVAVLVSFGGGEAGLGWCEGGMFGGAGVSLGAAWERASERCIGGGGNETRREGEK